MWHLSWWIEHALLSVSFICDWNELWMDKIPNTTCAIPTYNFKLMKSESRHFIQPTSRINYHNNSFWFWWCIQPVQRGGNALFPQKKKRPKLSMRVWWISLTPKNHLALIWNETHFAVYCPCLLSFVYPLVTVRFISLIWKFPSIHLKFCVPMHRAVLFNGINDIKGRQNDKCADIIKWMTYSWFMRQFYSTLKETIGRNIQIVQSYLSLFLFRWFIVKREKNPF